ncbi:glycosyltransferase family 39 protein [Clostridium drakei]|uniref:Uncharacterized protein n=1 Tax=Clostridium drakei TaxID=332101 RepID=A0A2U8DPR7_9CLOT|nr:glycosyltransferase family 39 protein [Clostridium drakei]AWI04224.1 hypothetical protein B9W14_06820 [Clostridium drakei]
MRSIYKIIKNKLYLGKSYYKLITMLGILICIIWVAVVDTKPFSDFAYYDEVARNIAAGGAWGDTYTSIGYSIVLGGIYKIFGSSMVIAKIFNLILTFFNYILIYNILKNVELKESKRRLVYALFVFFPDNIFYNSILATEILFTTILLLITLIYHKNIKHKYIIIGALTGLNTMIKPFFMIFFFAIFVIEIILKFKFIKVVKHSLIILVTSILVISPWIYRNTKLIGQLTYVSNNSGIVLYINNNSQNHYGAWMPASEVEDSIVNKKEYIKANMTQRNRMLSDAAKKWIKEHPIQFVELGFKRLYKTYLIGYSITYSFNGTGMSKIMENILTAYSSIISILVAAISIIVMIIYSKKIICSMFNKEKVNSYSVYNLICFYMFSCMYFITEGQPRYAFPVIFIMIYFLSNLTIIKKFR